MDICSQAMPAEAEIDGVTVRCFLHTKVGEPVIASGVKS
jgi:hypothetical protein